MFSSPRNPGGLPARWRRGRLIASLVSLIFIAGLFYPLRQLGRADILDAWWLAARFTFREDLSPPPVPDTDIVLVTLDDTCLEKWPEPTVSWNPHFARAIDRLRRSGARVIAMDWLQPNATEKWFPGNDDILIHALFYFHNIVWVMDAKHVRGNSDQPHFILPFSGFTSVGHDLENPDDFMGYAELTTDSSVVTSARPALPDAVSFAARIVERSRGNMSQVTETAWRNPGAPAIPLRDDGTILIDYANGTGRADFGDRDSRYRPFATYSLFDVAALPDRPDPRFRDKIVIVGAAWTGNNDQHFIPFLSHGAIASGLRLAHGVEIQANIVRNLLHGYALREPGPGGFWLLAVGAGIFGIVLFLRLRWLTAAILIVTVCLLWIAGSFAVFAWGDYALPINIPVAALLLSGGLIGGYLALSEERERKQVMGLWGQYQDPRLVTFLLQNPEARGGEGQEMEVTVLFADLKSFTKTVEHLSPTETITALNRYLEMLNSVIRRHGGIVDKYLGDGLMAQWGAPVVPGEPELAGHAETAVRSCLEIQNEASVLEEKLRAAGGNAPTFELRLTLHTGLVVFGWVGAKRLELTIIGDTVNVTSRLQETAKQLDVDFLVSESTFLRVQNEVLTGQQDVVEIRGRDHPLRVFEILGGR